MEGEGALPCRQEAPHPHMIQPSPDGKHAYACDLGANSVVGYRVDADRAKLTKVRQSSADDMLQRVEDDTQRAEGKCPTR